MANPQQQTWLRNTLTGIGTLVVCGVVMLMLLPGLQPDKPAAKRPKGSARIVTTMDGDVFTFEEIQRADNPDSVNVVNIYAGKTADGAPLASAASPDAMPVASDITCIYEPVDGNPIRVYEIDHTLLVWVWTPTGKCGGSSYEALNFTGDPHRFSFLHPVAARFLNDPNPAWRISFAGFLARYHDPAAVALIDRYARGSFTVTERATAKSADLTNARRYAEMLRATLPAR